MKYKMSYTNSKNRDAALRRHSHWDVEAKNSLEAWDKIERKLVQPFEGNEGNNYKEHYNPPIILGPLLREYAPKETSGMSFIRLKLEMSL